MTGKTQRLNKVTWLLVVAAAFVSLALAQNVSAAVLTADDCVKCHDAAPSDINSDGRKHKTEVSCVDCHEGGHPPKVTDIIPACSKCHEGTPHFDLTGCLGCHSNPHTPLLISLTDDMTDPCLTCHTEQMGQLQQYPSAHLEVACSKCHREKHGFIPECLHCHSGHTAKQTNTDCLSCHKPHMPLAVTYADDVASENCAGCHGDAYNLLVASEYKHSKLLCATCHKTKHKTIPACQDCHGMPHPAKMMEKFPKCGDCHGIAHDLNK
ncbi:MAG: cytochrome C [Proteobacteria bacterium]|nr:cytochrome C [Pseudomonadota bacterium]MBU1711054.1 cytochrome C [Pseudomonadota bacterium]